MDYKRLLRAMLLIFKIYLDKEEYANERSICIANMRCVAVEIKNPEPAIQYLLKYPLFSTIEEDNSLYNMLYCHTHSD